MKSLHSDRETAHTIAREARSVIKPNPEFVDQLEYFEKQLLHSHSTLASQEQAYLDGFQNEYLVKASAIKRCRWKEELECWYLEGNRFSELLDDILVWLRSIQKDYIFSKLNHYA